MVNKKNEWYYTKNNEPKIDGHIDNNAAAEAAAAAAEAAAEAAAAVTIQAAARGYLYRREAEEAKKLAQFAAERAAITIQAHTESQPIDLKKMYDELDDTQKTNWEKLLKDGIKIKEMLKLLAPDDGSSSDESSDDSDSSDDSEGS